MKLFKADSLKSVFIHAGIILSIFVGLILVFFYWYLPSVTKHGEYISVPKLEGLSIDQVEKKLNDLGLRYEISDSTFKPGITPLTVLTQHPLPGNEVKENRRIYLSIAAQHPPNIKMPKLIDESPRGAEMILKSLGLQMGDIKTAPHPYPTVLGQFINGAPVKEGTSIPKGSKIDLLVGTGRGETVVEIPNVVNMTLAEAKSAITGMGLVVGLVNYDANSKLTEGTVSNQKPAYQSGQKLRSGDIIDIVVSGTDPIVP